jgi:hypothetical protein
MQLFLSIIIVFFSYAIIPFVLLDFLKATPLKSRQIFDAINTCSLRTGSEKVEVLISKKYINMVFYLPNIFGKSRLIIGSGLVDSSNTSLYYLINDFFSRSLLLPSIEKILPYYFGAPFLMLFVLFEKLELVLTQSRNNKWYAKMALSSIVCVKFFLRPTLGPLFPNSLSSMNYLKNPQSRDLIEMIQEELRGLNSNNEILKRMIPV